jgi:hypothetical protein
MAIISIDPIYDDDRNGQKEQEEVVSAADKLGGNGQKQLQEFMEWAERGSHFEVMRFKVL